MWLRFASRPALRAGRDRTVLTDFDLIVFDCDGVLIDSEVLSCECLAGSLSRHGCIISLPDVFEMFLGRSFSAVRQHFHRATGQALDDDFVGAHRASLKDSFARSLQPMRDAGAVLDQLPLPYCLASSSDRERVDFCLAMTGLAERFADRIFTAEQVARGKPAPDLFLHAARAMRADPSRALVIEDSVNGVRAGKAAGMTVWGFVGGSHYADRDGPSLLTEAGADRIFHALGELRAA